MQDSCSRLLFHLLTDFEGKRLARQPLVALSSSVCDWAGVGAQVIDNLACVRACALRVLHAPHAPPVSAFCGVEAGEAGGVAKQSRNLTGFRESLFIFSNALSVLRACEVSVLVCFICQPAVFAWLVRQLDSSLAC